MNKDWNRVQQTPNNTVNVIKTGYIDQFSLDHRKILVHSKVVICDFCFWYIGHDRVYNTRFLSEV